MAGPAQIINPSVFRYIDNEIPTGVIDGVNLSYTTQYLFQPSTVKVYLNGLRLSVGVGNDYTIISNNTIVMNYAPLSGDTITLDYARKLN